MMSLNIALKNARRIFSGCVEDGLSAFDALLDAHPLQHVDILRERARAFAEIGRFAEAYRDQSESIKLCVPTSSIRPNEWYFAGEYSLELGQFVAAASHFEQAIIASEAEGSTYYVQSSKLLAALAHCQAGASDRATELLYQVNDDVEVLWVAGYERITRRSVKAILES